ncbi:hypothetical protein M5K25_022749 [Dendrobium thyrsiflorum]|uniref:Transcriptional coactivator p15 (PC4) C-terminal domain-containing protein n=1 Tax=Dendrobium thyrsiflorum TaxID=117978 RepID=A0ABD0UDL0_DENTH
MWRKGKRYGDDSGAGFSAQPAKFAKADSDDGSGDIVVCEVSDYLPLSKGRRVTVRNWQGRIVVDIREFYFKDGKELPGKKVVFQDDGGGDAVMVDSGDKGDPDVDHSFYYDEQGRVDILNSPFFDVSFGNDPTAEDYVERIIYQLTLAIEEQIPTGRWCLVSRRPTPPVSTSSKLATNPGLPNPVRPILPTHESNQGMPPTPSSRHLEHHPASFVGTDRGHHCGRDHPSLSNIRVAAPPYRSSPSLDGRPSIGSSFGSVTYDSPLGPTPSHLSQPLASPDLDSASEILVEKRIRKKRSPELETEYIHFVDANDITDNEDFFEDETEAITLGSLHDLNPELEPLNFNALVNPEPNPIKDIPLDKVYLNDINLISKETDLTLSTMELNSEDSDSIITSTRLTSHNSELIVDNPDEDNLDLGLSQLDLLPELYPDLIDPKSIELRVMTKHDHIENTNMSLEDRKLKLKDFELNWNKLESILGVAPLDLHLKESVLPDWAYHITLPTDLTENISPHFHVVPTPTLDTLPRLLSHIPTVVFQDDGGGDAVMVDSGDKGDPDVDHSFYYDEQGRVDILNSPFFDVSFGNDPTAEDYVERIIYQLTLAIEEQIPTGRWCLVSRRPTPLASTSSKSATNPGLPNGL